MWSFKITFTLQHRLENNGKKMTFLGYLETLSKTFDFNKIIETFRSNEGRNLIDFLRLFYLIRLRLFGFGHLRLEFVIYFDKSQHLKFFLILCFVMLFGT